MSTAILKGTTIDNPAFGIRSGQTVEVLLINQNVDITTFVTGPSAIQDTAIPLAQNTRDIASNQELVKRVKTFFFGEEQSQNNTVTVDRSPLGSLRQPYPAPSSVDEKGKDAEQEEGGWLPSSGAFALQGGLLSTWCILIASSFFR